MKNKWHASQVRIAQKWLLDTWPELFKPGRDLPPLGLKVHKQILQHPDRPADAPRRAVMEALKRHTGSFGYLFGMTKHSHRVGLDLEPLEPVSDEHKTWAQRTLRKRQKISQASKRKHPRAFQHTRDSKRDLNRVKPASERQATQITYKKARRRMVIKPIGARPAANTEVAAA